MGDLGRAAVGVLRPIWNFLLLMPGIPATATAWAFSGYAVMTGVPDYVTFALLTICFYALFLCLWAYLPVVWHERRVSVELVPQAGVGPDTRLHVRNRARTRDHWAHARIVAIRNGSDPRQGTYTMQWLNHTSQRVMIQRDDSDTLLVATWRSETGAALGEIAGHLNLIEISSLPGNRQVWDYLRWFTDDEKLPEIEVEVSVYAADVRQPHVETFTLVLPSVWGPWTVVRRAAP